MPLLKGTKNIGRNIAELHSGSTFKKTLAKHGKKAAQSQAIAISMRMAGKSNRATK